MSQGKEINVYIPITHILLNFIMFIQNKSNELDLVEEGMIHTIRAVLINRVSILFS